MRAGPAAPITAGGGWSMLKPGALYLGDNGRIMCGLSRCAGSTALASGHDLSGQKLVRVTVEDVQEWAGYDLGPMQCEGKHVVLSPIAGPDGWPLPRVTS